MAIADSTTIAKTNLYSQAYANLYNLINTRTNIADPVDSNGVRKFIYRREPRNRAKGFRGYPLIILHPIDISFDNPSFSKNIKDETFKFEIEIWSSDDIDNYENRGAEFVDTISNSLLTTLTSNESTLVEYGMYNMDISSSPADTLQVGNSFLFTRIFSISFKNRMDLV